MTATVVRVDDLDSPATCSPLTALANLADLHALPPYEAARPGINSIRIAATHQTAEPWRAALGAPAFTQHCGEHYSSFKTEVLWFGITVHLSYADH